MATIRNYKDIQLQSAPARSTRPNPFTPEYSVPDTPANFAIVVTEELSEEGIYELVATLSWDAVSSENTGYVVYYNIVGETDIQSFKLYDTNYIFTSINKTLSYEFWVTSVNVDVESIITSKITVDFTKDVIAPSPLASLSLYSGIGVSVISWTNPADSDFSHVQLLRGDINDRALATDYDTSPDSSYRYVNNIEGDESFFWTRTVDYTGNASAWYPLSAAAGLSVVTSLTSTYLTPSSVSGLALTKIYSISEQGLYLPDLKIVWTDLVSNFTGYRLEITNTDTAEIIYTDTVDNSFILQSVITGNTYSVKVKGINETSFGTYSTAETLLIDGDSDAPGVPTAVTVTNVVGGLEIMWTNPTDSDFSYTSVYASLTNDVGTSTLKYSGAITAYTLNEATEGTEWFFWLTSTDLSGNESGYEPNTTTTTYGATTSGDYVFSAPTVPTVTSAVAVNYSVRGIPYVKIELDYTSSSNATNYTIRWIAVADSPGAYETQEVINTSSIIYRLPIEDHYIGVQAHNNNTASAFSSGRLVTATTDTAPNADPTDLFINISSGGTYAYLNWTNSTEIDFKSTKIYRSATNDSSTATEKGDSFGAETWTDWYYSNTNYYYWIKFIDQSANLSGFYPSQFAGVNVGIVYDDSKRQRVSFTDLGSVSSGTVSPDIDAQTNNFKLTLTGAGVTIDAPIMTLSAGQSIYGKMHIIDGDTNVPAFSSAWSFCGGIAPELKPYSVLSFSKLFGDSTVFAWDECHPAFVAIGDFLVTDAGDYLVDDMGRNLTWD